jgi:hypothetical protein
MEKFLALINCFTPLISLLQFLLCPSLSVKRFKDKNEPPLSERSAAAYQIKLCSGYIKFIPCKFWQGADLTITSTTLLVLIYKQLSLFFFND